MNVSNLNAALLAGKLGSPGLFPHLERLRGSPFVFRFEFGLEKLPEQGGLLLIRGPRQYGKSTWLESRLHETAATHGPGSAFYLNGDAMSDWESLVDAIRSLLPHFSLTTKVKRLFIDEITAVADWQRGLKLLFDAGELEGILVISTGSRAADLRHGAERLPGRKGKLARTAYYFVPVGYAEFKRVCGDKLAKEDLLPAYLISGGSPVALGELASSGYLPEYVPEMVRDWIYGEAAASGRSRASLVAVLEALFRHGGTPLGQAKLAREAGLANNTVAAGYADLLSDLLCLSFAHAWDPEKRVRIMRKPAKFHFINLLAAAAWHPARLRRASDFRGLPPEEQGRWMEWVVAQEIWRREAIRGNEMPEMQLFWQGGDHELDFVLEGGNFVEVKRGSAKPFEFSWFPRTFPKGILTVVNRERFSAERMRGISLEDFLLEA